MPENSPAFGDIHGVPADVRQDRRVKLGDGARPLAEAIQGVAAFDAVLEEHLHADAHADHGFVSDQSMLDQSAAVDRVERGDHRAERTDARDEQAVGRGNTVAVGGELDPGTGALKGFRR